jgi:hypothetical protein
MKEETQLRERYGRMYAGMLTVITGTNLVSDYTGTTGFRPAFDYYLWLV